MLTMTNIRLHLYCTVLYVTFKPLCVLFLNISGSDVIRYCVSENMTQGIFPLDVSAPSKKRKIKEKKKQQTLKDKMDRKKLERNKKI